MQNNTKKLATEEPTDYNPHCKIYVNEQQTGKQYDVYLCNNITSPDIYSDLLNILFAAEEEDVVHLKINSPGGDLDTALQIQDAIKNSKAHVIGYLSGCADSAASAIFCVCDEHVVGEHALMLVHSVSHGFFAEAHDMLARSEVLYNLTVDWLTSTYAGFISEEEIEQIVVNKLQLLLTSDQIEERLALMLQKRNEASVNEEPEDKITISIVDLLSDMQYIKKWIEKQEASSDDKKHEGN